MKELIWADRLVYKVFKLKPIVDIILSDMYADRTNTYNDLSISIDPIPKLVNPLPLDYCIFKAGEDIWKSHDFVTCFWSGGIDSTSAVIGLMETKPNHAKLNVHYNKFSIDEFPSFYDKIIRPNWNPTESLLCEVDNIYVTGECGDQIFGSEAMERMLDRLDQPWEDIIFMNSNQAFREGLYTQELWEWWKPTFLEVADVLVQKSPVDIHTIKDFLWWTNFTQKWQAVRHRAMYRFRFLPLSHPDRNISFFNTQEFQVWSMLNRDIAFPNSKEWKSYKQPLKDFINRYHKDETYRIEKCKERSLGKVIDHSWSILTEDTIVRAYSDGSIDYFSNIR